MIFYRQSLKMQSGYFGKIVITGTGKFFSLYREELLLNFDLLFRIWIND